MNIVTANENKNIIDKLDIDIIKRIDGQYELRELLSKFVNLYFNKMIIDITSIVNYQDVNVIRQLGTSLDPNRIILLLNDNSVVNSPLYISNLIGAGFYNFTRNVEGIKFLYNNPNNYESVKHLVLSDEAAEKEAVLVDQRAKMTDYREEVPKKIIGLVDLTTHAGATSLTNMMVRQLNASGVKTIGIEMFRQDLIFYHDPNLMSCMNKSDLERTLKNHADVNAVIIDLNDFGYADDYCDAVLYLVEPSYVKLTRLLKKDKNTFIDRKGEKIVLNLSFVNDQEVPDFEYETKCKVFANLPPMNDRDRNLREINELLRLLGFNIDL